MSKEKLNPSYVEIKNLFVYYKNKKFVEKIQIAKKLTQKYQLNEFSWKG